MEFCEDDIVELTGETASRAKVAVGSHGKVTYIYPGNYYEVLFRRPDGQVLASAWVPAANLRLVKRLKQSA